MYVLGTRCVFTTFGVDRSSRFAFRARADRQTEVSETVWRIRGVSPGEEKGDYGGKDLQKKRGFKPGTRVRESPVPTPAAVHSVTWAVYRPAVHIF